MEKKENRSLQGSRILIAEDNKINQILIQILLENQGVVPEIVSNGRDAVEAVKKSDFDLILMDVQMPEMDGYEASRAIRDFEAGNPKFQTGKTSESETANRNRVSGVRSQQLPGGRHRTPIIAMTAHVMPGERERCLEAGMDDYLGKPVDADRMFAVLKNYIKAENSTVCETEIPHPPVRNSEPDLPGIDTAFGLRRLGGNSALYRKLLLAFSDDYAAADALVRENLEKGNTEQAGQLIHAIKGVAGNMGASALYRAADELESCIRNHPGRTMGETGSYTPILALFASALHQARKSAERMKAIPDDEPAPVYEKSSRTPEESSELKNLLEELAELLKDGDSEAMERMEKLKAHRSSSGVEKLMSHMEKQIFDFDFEEAAETLESIMMMLDIGGRGDRPGT